MPPQTTLYAELPTVFLTDAVKNLNFASYFDIGCGTGGFSIAIGLEGKKVLGIDNNAKAIEVADFKLRNIHLPRDDLVSRIDSAADSLDPNNQHFMGFRIGKELKRLLELYGDREGIYEDGPKFMGDFPEHETYLGNVTAKPDVKFKEGDALSNLGILASPYECIMSLNMIHFLEENNFYRGLSNITGLASENKGLIITLGSGMHGFDKDYWNFMEDLGFEQSPVSGEFAERIYRYTSALMKSGFLPDDEVSFRYSTDELQLIDYRCMVNGQFGRPPAVQSYIGTRKHVSSKGIKEKLKKAAENMLNKARY
jgi:SAM-dependent methyltransferase